MRPNAQRSVLKERKRCLCVTLRRRCVFFVFTNDDWVGKEVVVCLSADSFIYIVSCCVQLLFQCITLCLSKPKQRPGLIEQHSNKQYRDEKSRFFGGECS